MNYRHLIILITLCASLIPQTNLCDESANEGWTSWARRHMGYATSAATNLMTRTYNTVNRWSTATKTKIFLLTAAALIILGIGKDTLKQAIDQGISASGTISKTAFDIIKESPKASAALVGGGIALGSLKLKEIDLSELIEKAVHFPDVTTINEYVTALNNLDPGTDYYKYCIENICWKFKILISMKNLQYDQQYTDDLQQLKNLNSDSNDSIVSKLKENKEFWNHIITKMKKNNITDFSDLSRLSYIFEIIYLPNR